MSQNFNLNHFVDAQKALLSQSHALFDITLSGLEKLTSLNLETTRSLAESQLEETQRLLAAKDLNHLVSSQAGTIQPHLELLAGYARNLYEIGQELQGALSKHAQSVQSDVNQQLGSSLDWYANSNKGSELTVSAIKSALSAANSALDNAHKTVRQVADITEAAANAASSATVRAVSASSNPASRSKKAA